MILGNGLLTFIEKHLAHYPEVRVFYDVIDYKPFFQMIDPIDQGIIVAIDYGAMHLNMAHIQSLRIVYEDFIKTSH